MIKIDLNKLTSSDIIHLNLISERIKIDFHLMLEKVFKKNKPNKFVLLDPIFSRNPYQSNLFLNLCFLEFVKIALKDNKNIKEIVCQNKIQCTTFLKIFKKDRPMIKFSYPSKNFEKKINIIIFFKLIYKSLKSIYLKSKPSKEFLKKKKIILIDTFLFKNSLIKKFYVDRYYNGLNSYLTNNQKKRVFFAPTILAKPSYSDLCRIKKNSIHNIIYKHNFLKINDYLKSLQYIYRISKKKFDKIFFKEFDISPFINNEYKKNCISSSMLEGLLNYYFIKRLKTKSVDLSLLIDWNENQQIDKGLILGLKTYYPNVKSKGYRGFIISDSFNFYLNPTKLEIKNNVIPDVLCVIGNELAKKTFNLSTKVKIEVAPAYRFNQVFEPIGTKTNNNLILFILPIGLNESIDIIKKLKLFHEIDCYDILIRPHPLLDFSRVKKYLNNYKLPYSIDKKSSLNQLIDKSEIVVGNSSSVLIESICRGKPVIVIGSSKGLNQNPIPKSISNNYWQLCYTNDQFKKSILFFKKKLKDPNFDIRSKGNSYRKIFFEKPNKLKTLKFLEL